MNKKQYTLEEFEWVWKDSSVHDILNQFYYEHIELQKLLQQTDQLTNNWNELEEYLKGLIDNFKEDVSTPILHEQLAIEMIYEYMKQIKEGNNGN